MNLQVKQVETFDMKAMLMAAGKGTRLGTISETIPKVLLKINGKTLLRHAVEDCAAYGFDDIIINVHHLADMVLEEVSRLQKNGFRISVSDQRDMLLPAYREFVRVRLALAGRQHVIRID